MVTVRELEEQIQVLEGKVTEKFETLGTEVTQMRQSQVGMQEEFVSLKEELKQWMSSMTNLWRLQQPRYSPPVLETPESSQQAEARGPNIPPEVRVSPHAQNPVFEGLGELDDHERALDVERGRGERQAPRRALNMGLNPEMGNFNNLPKPKVDFPEFDDCNPRSWIRRCNQFFEYYQIPEEAKMGYVSLYVKGKIDYWLEGYMIYQRGVINWTEFSLAVCRRFGNMVGVSVEEEFTNLKQITTVMIYTEAFEEIRVQVLIVHPTITEAFFIAKYVAGLKKTIKYYVKLARPKTLLRAYEIARLYEEAVAATEMVPKQQPQYRNLMGRPNMAPRQGVGAVEQPRGTLEGTNKNLNRPIDVNRLREQGLCFTCKEKWHPGHKCNERRANCISGPEESLEENQEEVLETE